MAKPQRKPAKHGDRPPPLLLKRIVRVLALLCLAVTAAWIAVNLWVGDGDLQPPTWNTSLGFADALLVYAVFGVFFIVWFVAILTGMGSLAVAWRADRSRRPTLLWLGCLMPPIVLGTMHIGAMIVAQRVQMIQSPERTYILVAPGIVALVSAVYTLLGGLAAASLAYVVMHGGQATLTHPAGKSLRD